MAISIIQRPERYTPSGNPVIWQFSSSEANIHHFRVEVIEQSTGGIIYTGKFAPLPDLQNGTVVRLERFLSNIVTWQLDNRTEEFVVPITKSIKGYRVKVTEVLINNNAYVDGAVHNDVDDINYVYNAHMDTLSFQNMLSSDYLISSSNRAKFMTHKPSVTSVNMGSSEFLYFMQDGTSSGLKAVIKIYNKNGSLSSTHEQNIPSITQYNMYRLNVSPKAIYAVFGVLVADEQYYTVQLLDSVDQPKADPRTYYKRPAECSLEFVNLMWVNTSGGVDCNQFVNPTESKTNAKVSIKKNPFKIVSGQYKDLTADTYHTPGEVISNVPTVTVRVHTRLLKDAEVSWLGELIDSEQVFVELSDGKLVPVTLVNTSYNYQRSRYLQNQPNILNFDFQFEPGLVPALSNNKVSYIVTTSFSNSERSAVFTKDNCSAGTYGSQVVYTVPSGTFTSSISQAHANSLADAYLQANGQAYANANGTCETEPQVPNQERSQTFTRNNCGAGYTGTEYTYVVAAGTYFAATQEAANTLADNDIAANGQNAANANGTCVLNSFGNDEQSGTFTKQDCGSGFTGSSVTYTVAANTYYASTKEAANTMALNDVSANGQNYANANGTCVNNNTNVAIYIQTTTTAPNGSEKTYKFQAFSSEPTNTSVTVTVLAYDNVGNTVGTNTASISSGQTSSPIVTMGTYLNSLGVTLEATSVSPTSNNGYNYSIGF